MGADAGNTSGTPPGDASKIVRTKIHRVTAGVLKNVWGKLPAARSGPRSSSPVFSTARKCGDGERRQGLCPVASLRSATEKAPRDGDSHGGRDRFIAHDSRCSPRGRGASTQDSEVAMSDGHGEMPRLLGRFAGGSGDATTPPASASLRSSLRRVFCERKRRAGHKRRKWE